MAKTVKLVEVQEGRYTHYKIFEKKFFFNIYHLIWQQLNDQDSLNINY